MKYLCIDAGEKNIGIAVSDDTASFAFPETVLQRNENFNNTLIDIIKEKNISEVVIGLSQKLDGTENENVMKVVRDIESFLKGEGYVVHLEPEWYTTQEARRLDDDKKLNDMRSAAILLQSFLDKLKYKNKK